MHVSQTNLLTTVVQEPPAVLFSYIYFSCFSNRDLGYASVSQNSLLCYARTTVILQSKDFFFFFAFNVKKNISVFQSQLEFLSNVLFWKGYLIIPKEAERSELSLNRDSLS